MFEFNIRATEKDKSGYYYPDWEKAQKIMVKAETKALAMEKVESVLGKPSKDGYEWLMTIDDIQEI